MCVSCVVVSGSLWVPLCLVFYGFIPCDLVCDLVLANEVLLSHNKEGTGIEAASLSN